MAYQVYSADLTEENRALVLALLRLKEEAGKLEPGEDELLAKMRSDAALIPEAQSDLPASSPSSPPQRQGPRRSFQRRGPGNGRGQSNNGDRL